MFLKPSIKGFALLMAICLIILYKLIPNFTIIGVIIIIFNLSLATFLYIYPKQHLELFRGNLYWLFFEIYCCLLFFSSLFNDSSTLITVLLILLFILFIVAYQYIMFLYKKRHNINKENLETNEDNHKLSGNDQLINKDNHKEAQKEQIID